MDEPTANCDQVTDDAIQTMVRTAFSGSTLFTIAHRLSTIIDYDLVLVMDKGRCVELASPAELLKKTGGSFAQMVDALGAEGADLRRQAAEAAQGVESKKRI
jgi:ABC-type multidrug transport system fused ATPase/permease subunit